jgi:hypothetical protein
MPVPGCFRLVWQQLQQQADADSCWHGL